MMSHIDKDLHTSRRFRHHATTEHVFTTDEIEFLQAIEDFKNLTGKKFPTWSEALSVLLQLGYQKPNVMDHAEEEVALKLA